MEHSFTPHDVQKQINELLSGSKAQVKASPLLVKNIMFYVRGTTMLKTNILGDFKCFLN